MIERLALVDYQKHESLDIRLDPAVTAIVGPSDAGKSSVLRALRWAATNRPLGDGFVRDGADGCEVKLLVDGQTIKRKKEKGANIYLVGKRDYKAFGGDVPEPVSKLLNLTDANWQGQHDPPFWFSLTAGEVARQLNRIVDLELIDTVMSRLGGLARSLGAEAGVVGKRVGEAEERLESLATAPRIDSDLKAVEGLEAGLDELVSRVGCLDGLTSRATEVWSESKRLGEKTTDLQELLQLFDAGRKLEEREFSLGRLMAETEKASSAAVVDIPDLAGLDRLREKIDDDGVKKLAGLVFHVRELIDDVADLGTDLEKAIMVLRKETKGRCPLCGGEMKDG